MKQVKQNPLSNSSSRQSYLPNLTYPIPAVHPIRHLSMFSLVVWLAQKNLRELRVVATERLTCFTQFWVGEVVFFLLAAAWIDSVMWHIVGAPPFLLVFPRKATPIISGYLAQGRTTTGIWESGHCGAPPPL